MTTDSTRAKMGNGLFFTAMCSLSRMVCVCASPGRAHRDHVATRDESYDAVRESRDTATAEVERLRAENTALHERVLSLLHGGTEQVCSLPARPAVHGCDTVRVHR